MFKLIYFRLRKIYNSISKFYASIIIEHPIVSIICYVLLIIIFGFGLFQLKFNKDNESLTHVRNSLIRSKSNYLKKFFPQNQYERYFQHQLTDLGYYFEIIILLKNPDESINVPDRCSQLTNNLNTQNLQKYSFMNQTLINEYNKLYDHIYNSLTIEDTDNVTLNLKYHFLCAKRLNKCAVEGGLMRAPSFQKNLLNHHVSYDLKDSTKSVLDTEALDGTSVDFLFGKCRKELCLKEQNGKTYCYLKDFMLIRNRFDLLSNTNKEKELSVRFMHKFAQYMDNMTRKAYPYFDISYYTSHTLDVEIQNYSLVDMKYVALCIISFWIVYFLLILIQTSTIQFRKCVFNKITKNNKISMKKNQSKIKEKGLFCLTSCSLFAVLLFIQFLFTIIASLGAISILGIEANQLLFYTIFVIIINSGHQSYLVFSSVSSIYENNVCSKANRKQHIVVEEFNSNIKIKIEKLVEQLIFPNMISLINTIITYLIICFTSSFDSVRIYSAFLIIACIFNFIGLSFFYLPSLILYCGRISCLEPNPNEYYENKNSQKHSEEILESEIINSNTINFNSTTSSNDVENKTITVDSLKMDDSSISSFSKDKSNWIILYSILYRKADFLFNTKFKHFILLLFSISLIINILICAKYSKINIPLRSLVPTQSYLRKHMDNHYKYFEMGPIVIVNILKPLDYSNVSTYSNIKNLKSDLKSLAGMNQFDMNWYDEIMKELEKKNEFDDCKNHTECFYQKLESYKKMPQYEDDIIIQNNSNIRATRFYLQFRSFEGSLSEVTLMNNLQEIAHDKHKFDQNSLVIISSVFIFLEQLSEMPVALISIILISIESIYFIGLFLFFDLKSIIILLIISLSFFLSVLSNLFLLDISINFITLLFIVMLPSIIFEFTFRLGFIFILKNKRINDDNDYSINEKRLLQSTKCETSNTTSKSIKNLTNLSNSKIIKNNVKNIVDESRFKSLKNVFRINLNNSNAYLISVTLFSLSFLYFTKTYTFKILYIFMLSTFLNILIHISLFYPILLIFFGTTWEKYDEKKNKSLVL